MSRGWRRWPWLWPVMGWGLFIFLLYGRLLISPQVWDDGDFLTAVKRPFSWSIGSLEPWGWWKGAEGWPSLWPLLALRGEQVLFGAAPFAYHLAPLLLLWGCALLAWRCLSRWLKKSWLAVLAVALWLAHPLLVEPLWLLGWRAQLWAGLLVLAALDLSLSAQPGWWRQGVIMALLILALLCAPAALAFFPLALLLLGWREGGMTWPRPAASFWLGLAVAGLFLAGSAIATSSAARPFAPLQALLLWPSAALSGIARFLFPYPLYPERSLPALGDRGAPLAFLALCVFALAIGLFRRCRRRCPLLCAGLAWFAAALIPAWWGMARRPLLEDGQFFLPALGLAAAIAGLGWAALERRQAENCLTPAWRRGAAAVAAALCLALVTANWLQQSLWADPLRLAQQAIRHVPESGRAQMQLALAYYAQGQWNQAQEVLTQVQKKAVTPATLGLMALIKSGEGKREEALHLYDFLLQLDPRQPGALNNRAALLRELNRRDEAIADLERARQLDPTFEDALYNLGLLYREAGRKGEARAALEQAAKLKLTAIVALELAMLDVEEKNLQAALTILQRAIAVDHSSPQAYNILGVLYAELQALGKAEAVWREGLARHPQDRNLQFNLHRLQSLYEPEGKE